MHWPPPSRRAASRSSGTGQAPTTNMNEHQFGNKIRQVLNEGLRRDTDRSAIAERLRAARERALARQRPEPVAGLAWADNVVGGLGGWSGVSLRLIAPVMVLAVA